MSSVAPPPRSAPPAVTPADDKGSGAGPRRRWWLGGAFSVIVVVVAGLALIAERVRLRESVGRELQTNAELKAREIADWREERLGEARFLSLAPGVAGDVATVLEFPDSPLARQRVVNWLDSLKGGERYESVALLDPALHVRVSVPEGVAASDPLLRQSAQAVLSDGEIVTCDLHRATPAEPVHLEFLAPIFPPPEEMPRGLPAAGGRAARPIAVVVLRVRPEHKLFPLLLLSPTPSRTGETKLVRIENDTVVYLSPVRHRNEGPLAMRRPVQETQFAPGITDESRTQPAEWTDYRGEKVIAAIRRVPATPWYVISKIDTAEALAPLRRAAWQTAGTGGLLVALAFLASGYAGSRHDRRQLQHALDTARANAFASKRQALLSAEANDAIILVDDQGRIVEANSRASSFYGYTPEELKRLTVADLRVPEQRRQVVENMRLVRSQGSAVFETEHLRKDGREIPVEVSGRVVEIDGEPHFLSVVRDLTERKRSEEAQRARAEVEDQFAKIASSVPGMVYSFRRGPDERMTLPFCTGRIAELWGLTHEEVREDFRRALDRLHPDDIVPTRDGILRSARDLSVWYGRFRVLHPTRGERWLEGQSVPQREADGGTLWHGYIQDVTEREEVRRTMEESEARLRLALAAANQGMFDLNIQTGEAKVSPEYATMLGYDPATFVESNAAWIERLHPDDRERAAAVYRDYVAGRLPEYRVEFRQRTRDGGWKWILSVGRIVARTPAGEPLRLLGTHTDISREKEIEAALAAQVKELQRWHAITLGRETRLLELKAEVNRLLTAAGQPPRYSSPEVAEWEPGGVA